jgi:hypothetical protein
MDKLNIKATLYDIIGYIIPGLFFILGIVIISNSKSISDQYKLILMQSTASPSVAFVMIALCVSYFLGIIISTLSSLIFESSTLINWLKKLSKVDNSIYDNSCKILFSKPYDDCDKRAIIAYCQINFPIIYDTAFVFLGIYGFARNMSLIILVFAIANIFVHGIAFYYETMLLLLTSILSFFTYIRFSIYFDRQVNSSLLIKKVQ